MKFMSGYRNINNFEFNRQNDVDLNSYLTSESDISGPICIMSLENRMGILSFKNLNIQTFFFTKTF